MIRQLAVPAPTKFSRKEKDRFFQFLLFVNFLEYLEAGAVPALLLQLSTSFHMSPGQQGLLGGVVYLSLSIGGPFAGATLSLHMQPILLSIFVINLRSYHSTGYLLRHHDHRTVIGYAVVVNNFFTLLWALTPVNMAYSIHLFIALRFLMGLTQCVMCVFLPLWTNQFAPKEKKTSWMGYLQVFCFH